MTKAGCCGRILACKPGYIDPPRDRSRQRSVTPDPSCRRRIHYSGRTKDHQERRYDGNERLLAFVDARIAYAIYRLVALLWLVADRRIEKVVGRTYSLTDCACRP